MIRATNAIKKKSQPRNEQQIQVIFRGEIQFKRNIIHKEIFSDKPNNTTPKYISKTTGNASGKNQKQKRINLPLLAHGRSNNLMDKVGII